MCDIRKNLPFQQLAKYSIFFLIALKLMIGAD